MLKFLAKFNSIVQLHNLQVSWSFHLKTKKQGYKLFNFTYRLRCFHQWTERRGLVEESYGWILPGDPLAPRCKGEFIADRLTIEPWTNFSSLSRYYATEMGFSSLQINL